MEATSRAWGATRTCHKLHPKRLQNVPLGTLQNGGYIARLGDYKNVPQIALEDATRRSTRNATKWRLHRALGWSQERATNRSLRLKKLQSVRGYETILTMA